VIDTNLFVSGLFSKHTVPARLQDLWIERKFELITSLNIIREISRVLAYPTSKSVSTRKKRMCGGFSGFFSEN
jgi:putative PIN family toxin of toxin-antitoxin system